MLTLLPAAGALSNANTTHHGRRNILFLISDDFRPSSGAYGNEFAQTPHLDRLASEGTLFTAAHVQFAYCAPSRNSFMSGRRPDATKAYNFLNHFREKGVGDEWVALPELFKRAGYLVTGANKLYRAPRERTTRTRAPGRRPSPCRSRRRRSCKKVGQNSRSTRCNYM